jgi:hypothetical protein
LVIGIFKGFFFVHLSLLCSMRRPSWGRVKAVLEGLPAFL